jgi:hypothetical protein
MKQLNQLHGLCLPVGSVWGYLRSYLLNRRTNSLNNPIPKRQNRINLPRQLLRIHLPRLTQIQSPRPIISKPRTTRSTSGGTLSCGHTLRIGLQAGHFVGEVATLVAGKLPQEVLEGCEGAGSALLGGGSYCAIDVGNLSLREAVCGLTTRSTPIQTRGKRAQRAHNAYKRRMGVHTQVANE